MKAFKTKIDKVLEKRVSRKKFLQLLGIGAVTIPLLSPTVAASYFIRQSDGNLIDIDNLPSDGGVGGSGTSNELAVWSGNKSLTGDSNLVWSGGNLGIGTTSPTDKLDVFSSTNNQRLLRISHPTAPNEASGFLGFNTDGTTNNNIVTLGVQYSNIYYDIINIQRSTRNVGISTTNPIEKLDVAGKVRMRTQTAIADADDIVATKKYVDDEIDTAIAGTTDGTVTEVDTGTGLTGGPITDTGTISIDTTWAAQFNSVSIGINEVISSTRALTVTSASITGELDMNTNRILNLAEPTLGTDAATKGYVDSMGDGSGETAIWGQITGTLSEQTDLQSALDTKAQDAEVVKLTGAQTIEGVKTFSNDIILNGNAGIGTTEPHEKIDVNGNIRIREQNSTKYGGTGATDAKFEIKYNADTESLDFNFLG